MMREEFQCEHDQWGCPESDAAFERGVQAGRDELRDEMVLMQLEIERLRCELDQQ